MTSLEPASQLANMITKAWHLWPGQGWPMLPAQERQFVADLEAASKGVASRNVDRDVVSVLLVALRCGTPFDEVRRLAPGLKAKDLLGAYRSLDRLRSESEQAWIRIEEDPTLTTLTKHARQASLLLPLAINRILGRADRGASAVAHAIAAASSEVHRIRVVVHGIEHELAHFAAGDRLAAELATQLYNPVNPGLYGHSFFLPDRVSTLTPLRVRELLGEPRELPNQP